MKRILLLTTGGTIASKPTADGSLAPALSSADLVEAVPELTEICSVDLKPLCSLDSTNMGPAQWKLIASAIKEDLDTYDGVVITHGTDTMAYTAAALSYMLRDLPIPVVLTGSQKSIANRDTDARNNLLCAFRYVSSDHAWGVQIVFDGKVILGTRARKERSKSFNAFSSIDYPETAVFSDKRLIPYIEKPDLTGTVPRIYTEMDPKVFFLRLIPGMDPDIFTFLTEKYDAIVIEAFGVGGLPDYGEQAMLKAVRALSESGKLIVFTTQVQHEGSDLAVYEVGKIASQLPGVLDAGIMTPEAIVTKLMWALANSDSRAEAGHLFLTPIQHDML